MAVWHYNYKLHCLDVKNIYKTTSEIEKIHKLGTYYGYHIIWKYEKNSVIVWDFIFNICDGDFPKDILIGDYVSFECVRIDFY